MSSATTAGGRVLVAALLLALVCPALASAAEPVADLQVSNVAISPDGNGLADATEITFELDERRWVRGSVVRADTGAIVRQLWAGELPAGRMQLAWDGTDAGGARVGDGAFRVRIEAWKSAGAPANARAFEPTTAPVAVVERDVHVDTRAPALTPVTAHPRHRAGSRMLELPVRLSEEAMVDVRVYDGTKRRAETLLVALPLGSQRITVRTSDKLFRSRRAGAYRIELVVSDAAWNVTRKVLTVRTMADPRSPTPPSGSWTSGSDGVGLPTWLRPIMLRATTGAGVPRDWAMSPALAQLIMHESSFNPTAQNPTSTAYGLFQFLDQTWAGSGGRKTSDPYLQSVYGLRYIKRRYRTPERAWAFWQAQSPHWYTAPPRGPQTPVRRGLGGVRAFAVSARISTLELSHAAISPDGDGRADAVDVTAELDVLGSASVTVQDQSGAVVRTLWASDLPAGRTTLSWDGSRDDGSRAVDGAYSIVVRTGPPGTGTVALTERSAAQVRVDTTAPTPVRATSAPIGARGTKLVRIPLQLSEEAQVVVSLKDGSATRALTYLQPAGASFVEIRPPAAWARAKRASRGSITLQVSDAAWNVRSIAVPVNVLPAPVAPVAPTWGGGPLMMPTRGVITSHFGLRGGRAHEGIDIGASTGTPIHAAAAGRVVYAGWASGYGNVVYLDHGNGLVTRYGHQSRIATRTGSVLRRGQVLGYVGSTGRSTGPHLHFEVRINGAARNPLQYL